jgi:hypothetical protein
VVEDSRIERKIKYKYPGLKNSFVKAYQDLYERDFFSVKDLDVNELNFIDRVNLHCKVGAMLNIQFTDEERALLDEVENTETYDDVIDLTKKIVEFMKGQIENKQEQKIVTVQTDGESGETKEEKGNSEENSAETEETVVEEDSRPKQDETSQQENGDEEEKTEPGKGVSEKETPKTENNQSLEEQIRSFTDDAFYENQKQLFDQKPSEYSYVTVPQLEHNQVFDHKDLWKKYKEDQFEIDTKEFIKLRNETNKVVSYLVKEFEMRKNADQLKRASTAKTGDLDMKKIFSYEFSEDIFKKISVIPGGKSHGLVMFIDWSGSMIDHMANTMKQLINLVMFCKKVNIPYEVYAFAEDTLTEKTVNHVAKKNEMLVSRYGLLNLLSSRMTVSEFTYAASALVKLSGINSSGAPMRHYHFPYWMSMSGTPLNEAIIHAMTIVPEFQKKNKLQIVNTIFLTDGEGRTIREYADSNNYGELRRHSIRASTVYVRDPITRHQEAYGDIGNGKYVDQTTALLKLLRLRTNSNVIGFYVCHGRDFNRKVYTWFPKSKHHETIKEDFRKSNFSVVEESGYNEYYILRSSGLDTDDDAVFDVKENITSKGLVSAFTKFNSGRHNSRVVLNRFIKLIA